MNGRTIVLIVIICLFLFLLISIFLSIKGIKKESDRIKNKKDELVNNNKFIMERKDKYEKIMDKNASSLVLERIVYKKRAIIYILIVLSSLALFFIFKKGILLILIPIAIIVPGLIWGKDASSYLKESSKMFNETVASILKEYDSNLNYYPYHGFKAKEYHSLYFAEPCNIYRSHDLIVNSKSGFFYADITIESVDDDDEGSSYHIEFDGSLARMNISNIGCTIILGGLSDKSFKNSEQFKIIKFENEEFNKEFTCFADNEMMAYKILTPNVMEKFINIRNSNVSDIDIRIINDKLYIRFEDTNGFDGGEESKDELFQSVAVLDKIIKTMNEVKLLIHDNLNCKDDSDTLDK